MTDHEPLPEGYPPDDALYAGDHMKTIRHTSTLFHYDGPQVFEARDAIGGHYIAVMVESAHSGDRYLVAAVEPERLRQFRCGTLDLRSLLTDRREAAWYLATVDRGIDEPFAILRQDSSITQSPLLPDSGFVLQR